MKKLIVVMATAAVFTMLTLPALAATNWKFGASLRYETFWNHVDYGRGNGPDLQSGGITSLDDDGALAWGLRNNSRIKMNMSSDSLEGYIELGYDYDVNTITAREYWGRYKFAEGWAITIGQQHQLFNTTGLSNQVWGGDLGMHGLGTSWRGASPKITLSYGGFSFALAQPYTGTHRGINGMAAGTTFDRDLFLPALQASYQYKNDTSRIKLAGAYMHQRLSDFSIAALDDENINSWLISLDGAINFGPLYLAGAVSAGQNWADAEWNTKSSIAGSYTNGKTLNTFGVHVSNGDFKNTTSVMLAIIAGYQLTEALRFEAGAGYRYDTNKVFENDSNIFNIYIQARYNVAPGFSITPEIGYIDWGKGVGNSVNNTKGADLGYTWYAGAKWQLDF